MMTSRAWRLPHVSRQKYVVAGSKLRNTRSASARSSGLPAMKRRTVGIAPLVWTVGRPTLGELVEVVDLDSEVCIQLMRDFIAQRPDVWNEDIGED